MNTLNLEELNAKFRQKSPEEIIQFGLELAQNPVLTTNFRPYEVAILKAVSSIDQNIKVIWCDTGYNTPNTYKHAEQVIDLLSLKIHLYVPKQTAAHRDITLGIPHVDDPKHAIFTEQVKLEPFKRAMNEHQPDLWFTNLRNGQTAFRNNIDIFSQDSNGLLKISPFYHWTDDQLDAYLEAHNLPNEFTYFDPTKQLENRECGLHK
ncbi:MAG: phosphoadenosine phosphosulfate reductase family protein [Crocinitomicaceae bacterium]|nr:phosphoadenosine phosphosulfate reductase family protein [Crocinitomicaceae bacterium]